MLYNSSEFLQESCAKYWPNEESSQFGEFTVNLVDKEGTPGFVMRKFIIESTKVCSFYFLDISYSSFKTFIPVSARSPSDPVPCDQLVS